MREFTETGKIYLVSLYVIDTENKKVIIHVELNEDCSGEDEAIELSLDLAIERGYIDNRDDLLDVVELVRYSEIVEEPICREISQSFTLGKNELRLIVVEEETVHQCKSCYFLSSECGFLRQYKQDHIGACQAEYRKDKKNVFFKKV